MVESVEQKNTAVSWPTVGLIGGITAVFLGYLSVWIPGPAAGLQFIGVEVGEWLKFLGVGRVRNIFYFPPITLGVIIVLYSFGWSNRRLQSWVWRALGCGIALISFPALEDIRGASQGDYFPRIWLILSVWVLFLIITGISFRQIDSKWPQTVVYLVIAILGIVGAFYPTWLYNAVRPAVALVMGESIGIGLGVYLNALGHFLISVTALTKLRQV
ncbi:MAG: hypothetical protein AAF490_05805 [Chloroflexota bacterium]